MVVAGTSFLLFFEFEGLRLSIEKKLPLSTFSLSFRPDLTLSISLFPSSLSPPSFSLPLSESVS
jgi:hypothetical protein